MRDFETNDNVLKRLVRAFKWRILTWYAWRDKLPYFLFSMNRQSQMPDVIIAGLPKTSTTWIAKTLAEHQKAELRGGFRENRGEINYFTSFVFMKPLKDYFLFNSNKKVGKIYIEKSPTYAALVPSRIRLIKKLNPNIKIIIGFRDPVDWLISFAKMEMVSGRRNLQPTEENWNEFENYYKWKKNSYQYSKNFNSWYRVFRENLFIVDFQDVKSNPKLVIENILEFLNLDNNGFTDGISLGSPNNTSITVWPKNHISFLKHFLKRDIDWYENEFSEFKKMQSNSQK